MDSSCELLKAPQTSHVAGNYRIEECLKVEEEGDDFLIQEADHESSGPCLFGLYEAMLEESEVPHVTTEDAYVSSCKPHISRTVKNFPTKPHDLMSDRQVRAHCKLSNITFASSRSPSRNGGMSGFADCADELLTHVDDHGKGPQSTVETHQMLDPIGQTPLTHNICSTWSNWVNEIKNTSEDVVEDVHIFHFAESSTQDSRSDSLIDPEYEAQDLLFSYDQGPRAAVQPDKQQNSSQVTDMSHYSEVQQMAAQRQHHSLSEVLGNDQFLWNMWKRRKSTAPPAEDEMLEMHNMFENDPDMRVLSTAKTPESSYADLMMFDAFTFSRDSSRSEATSPCSSASEDLDLFLDSKVSTQSSNTSTVLRKPSSSPRDAKQHKRRSSVLKMITRPARFSEDDIQFQQRSPTRDVDIKKRKTLRDYHDDGL
ncbi:hypothetical protein H2198_002433 [Neophaeococcomyces mojaviensis]|uniref:Uncharacterized protein n=1 Tax=Neophaeococcomyces mojaviensis TaxID=3383035 RepID=A0ACC3AES1_9EURO|nr:hypothetical protein H2198_002433 [Knufia sp. JES_112]